MINQHKCGQLIYNSGQKKKNQWGMDSPSKRNKWIAIWKKRNEYCLLHISYTKITLGMQNSLRIQAALIIKGKKRLIECQN